MFILLLPFFTAIDYSAVAGPGWHLSIYPPYFIWLLLFVIVFLFSTIGYWLFINKTGTTNRILFIFHVACTIPAILYLTFPSIFLNSHNTGGPELYEQIYDRIKFIPIAWAIFIVAQILFPIYFSGAFKSSRSFVKE
ncbi:MAG: hypothetical protein WAU24_12205 [Chitinophagaceae bacterium]